MILQLKRSLIKKNQFSLRRPLDNLVYMLQCPFVVLWRCLCLPSPAFLGNYQTFEDLDSSWISRWSTHPLLFPLQPPFKNKCYPSPNKENYINLPPSPSQKKTRRGSPVDRRPSTAEDPPIGKINPLSKMAVIIEPLMWFWCPLESSWSLWYSLFYNWKSYL